MYCGFGWWRRVFLKRQGVKWNRISRVKLVDNSLTIGRKAIHQTWRQSRACSERHQCKCLHLWRLPPFRPHHTVLAISDDNGSQDWGAGYRGRESEDNTAAFKDDVPLAAVTLHWRTRRQQLLPQRTKSQPPEIRPWHEFCVLKKRAPYMAS